MSKFLKVMYTSMLLAVVTTYLSNSFYHWNFDPDKWGNEGRMSAIFLYFIFLTLYVGVGQIDRIMRGED
jgi:hypothetical protein